MAKRVTKTVAKAESAKETAVKKNVVIESEIQFNGHSIKQDVLCERIMDAWSATGHDKNAIEKLELYLKPSENRAYYVINSDESGSVLMF